MCGLAGAINVRKAAELVGIALHTIQHRAVDYVGICATDGRYFYRDSGEGIVRNAFTGPMYDKLHGRSAIGHIRYPTVDDDPKRDNTQPIEGRYCGKPIAIAHNGNLTNTLELSRLVLPQRLSTSMDSEYILRLLEEETNPDIDVALTNVLRKLKGSFELLILLPDRLIAVRDPQGNHPLSIGKAGDSYFVASESCAFPSLEAAYMGDVEPGTFVSIDEFGTMHTTTYAPACKKQCRFESIYFSIPTSRVYDENVGQFRIALGRELERLCPAIGADIVVGIPDSSNAIAKGYGESGRSGMCANAILRSHYAGRTFIAATQAMRDAEVAQKFSFSADDIAGKKVVIVDDSIVRGTTLPKIVRVLRMLGAIEVHVRIGSPPFRFMCTYGINTPTSKELISHRKSPKEIGAFVGADSLQFMPLEALRSLSNTPDDFCYSCMTGEYW